MDYKDIPQFPHSAYEIDVQWSHIEAHLEDCVGDGLDLDPDYQRGHRRAPRSAAPRFRHLQTSNRYPASRCFEESRWE